MKKKSILEEKDVKKLFLKKQTPLKSNFVAGNESSLEILNRQLPIILPSPKSILKLPGSNKNRFGSTVKFDNSQ